MKGRAVVYKIGGSLLTLPRLAEIIHSILAQRPGTAPLLVVGGGGAADLVREWDRIHHLGPSASHWLALSAMQLNEALLQQLLPGLRLVRSPRQFEQARADQQAALFCAECFVRWGTARGNPLPESWDVTSDSIAAWAAQCVQADELVLIKSVDCPEHASPVEASTQELVDLAFPSFVAGIAQVGWVNARAEQVLIKPWLSRAMTGDP